MAVFRPGVGKIYMKAIDRFIRNKFCQKDRGVGADDSDICKIPSADSVDGIAVIPRRPFDAEKIDLGIVFSLIKQKGGLSRPDFDLNRCVLPKSAAKSILPSKSCNLSETCG